MKTLTEDQFIEQYKPIKNHLHEGQGFDDCLFETYGADLDYVRNTIEAFVWTISDDMSITSGYHFVNRLGYLITELPADDDFIDVIIPDDEEE